MFENIHPYFVSELDHRERVRQGLAARRTRRLARRGPVDRAGRAEGRGPGTVE